MSRVFRPYNRFDERFDVQANTFGVPFPYNLTSINVSKSGLLTGSKRILPFRLNTLIELTIDPTSSKLSSPVHCIGKVVRFASEERGDAHVYQMLVGIEINEGLDEHFSEWEKYCVLLEEQTATE